MRARDFGPRIPTDEEFGCRLRRSGISEPGVVVEVGFGVS